MGHRIDQQVCTPDMFTQATTTATGSSDDMGIRLLSVAGPDVLYASGCVTAEERDGLRRLWRERYSSAGMRKAGKTTMGMEYEAWLQEGRIQVSRQCCVCDGAGSLYVIGWFGRRVRKTCAACKGAGKISQSMLVSDVLPHPSVAGAIQTGIAGTDMAAGQAVVYDPSTGTLNPTGGNARKKSTVVIDVELDENFEKHMEEIVEKAKRAINKGLADVKKVAKKKAKKKAKRKNR